MLKINNFWGIVKHGQKHLCGPLVGKDGCK
jgi:hypothetical protein